VVVAQGGLQLDLLDGIARMLSVAQNTLNGALPQLSHQWLLQASMTGVNLHALCEPRNVSFCMSYVSQGICHMASVFRADIVVYMQRV